jgi:hypothetical protein
MLDGFFGRKSRREEQRRAERAAYRERLLSPRWEEVEAALGRPVPAILRELYANEGLVTSGDFLVLDPARDSEDAPFGVSQFLPADAEALAPTLVSIPPGTFSFATNEYGDPFYVQLGELADGDGRVFVHYHDGDDTELVAPSLRTLLGWPRERS